VNPLRKAFLRLNSIGYRVIRPVIFRQSAQEAHETLLQLLTKADKSILLCHAASMVHEMAFDSEAISIGGVQLSHPFILAAGFVKGHGFEREKEALKAVQAGENIIPGWKSVPKLLGTVELGSFTRHPRMGNAGTVIWRDPKTQSTQNRVGLKNPGAVAAAEFMLRHVIDLPQVFGVNIAVSPGVNNEQAVRDVRESFAAFLDREVVPNWFTLNISCPNTEDDPGCNQTEDLTRNLCQAALEQIHDMGYDVPLWVKISPDLAESQYKTLMRVFAELGVKAVISTNTLGQAAPNNPNLQAGIGGGKLHAHALQTAKLLHQEALENDYAVDVIGCGGILDGERYLDYKVNGIRVVQYWSALVYRGPLAAAIIESDLA
jgi:dihydroorotate dehydrogenase